MSVENVQLDDFTNRIGDVLCLIIDHGMTDGAHHKQWVIDQIARIILKDQYDDWVKSHICINGEWDIGIAP